MKRILSSLLMLTMLLSLMPFALPAMASDTSTEVYYYDDFTGGTTFADSDGYSAVCTSDNGVSVLKMTLTGESKVKSPKFTIKIPLPADRTQDLYLEYRVKIKYLNPENKELSDRYYASWNTSATQNRLKTVAFTPSGIATQGGAALIDEITYNFDEYHTVAIRYPFDENKRDIYLDGELIASPAGDYENAYYVYSSATSTELQLLPSLRDGDYAMLDYIKISGKPTNTSVTAEIIDARDSGVVVGFSSAPVNVSTSNFSLANGTAIESIERINETTFRVIPASALTADDTLTVSGITDALGLSLVDTDLDIAFNASSYAGNEYINYHFNDSALPSGLSTYNDAPYTISNGVLTIQPNSSNVGYMTINKITNNEDTLPEFVLEFKNKVNNQESGSYMSYHPNASLTPMFFYCANTYLGDYNSWCWADRTKTPEGTIDDVTKWHTYAIKFSNTDNTRSLYIDGECVGTSTDASGNTWYANDSAWFRIKLYSAKGTMTSDYDYIKAYAPADNFTATIIDNTATELNKLTLDFNATAANISPANIRVNGNVPASVTCVDEENQKYEVVLSTALQPETDYKVSLNGVTNTIAQTAYDVLSFKTRALKEGEVYYNIAEGGIVKADGVEITDGTFADAVDTIVVKANKGYKPVVKVNGTETAENNKYGEYTIDTANGAEIEVLFEAAETPLFSTPLNFVSEEESGASYTFVRLNMVLPETDFGVIVSSDSDKLDAEDVDGVNTFMLPATNGSNAFGEYGIKILDKAEGNVFGNTYYVRPYAVLDGTYYYQNPVTVNVTTVQ